MRKADPDFDKSPAEKAADKITKQAGIKDAAGEKITEIIDIPMVVPRGKYTFQVFNDYFKLHGKTHDYKLAFKDVNRAFLLHKNDNVHTSYVLALNSPVRSGQTQHYFLVFEFPTDFDTSVTLNISDEEREKQFPELGSCNIEGKVYHVLSQLIKIIAKKTIIVPSGFSSHKNEKALKCSIKANEGLLFPLKKSLIFIHKPVSYIKISDISYIELSRVLWKHRPVL